MSFSAWANRLDGGRADDGQQGCACREHALAGRSGDRLGVYRSVGAVGPRVERSFVDIERGRLHTPRMMIDRKVLATIGYEAADLTDFITTLHSANVTRLIDVREIPVSRRKGFAKRALSEALTRAGIEYLHLRGLGDPKEGRQAARAGDFVKFKRVFNNHMRSDSAQTDLEKAAQLAAEGGACLMCYERDHTSCHRAIVAAAISGNVSATIRHLVVGVGLGRQQDRSGSFELVQERT